MPGIEQQSNVVLADAVEQKQELIDLLDELEAAVSLFRWPREKAESQLHVAGRKGLGQLLQPLDMKLKILVKGPLIAGRLNRGQAPIGPQRGADFKQQSDLR